MKHPTTSPFAFVIHSLLALFFGALGAGALTVIQLVASGTVTDLRVVVAGGATAFGAYFGAGFILLEKDPATKQALVQAGNEVLTRVDQLQQSHAGLLNQVGQLIGHVRQLSALIATPPTVIGQAPIQVTLPQNVNAAAGQPMPQIVTIPPGQSTLPSAFPGPLSLPANRDWTGLEVPAITAK